MIDFGAAPRETNAPPTGDGRWSNAGRAWLGVGLLTAAYVLSYIDRTVLSLLVEPIKQSLHLSDTQIGLLQGLAFSLFFTATSLPAGWLADRSNRTRLIALGIGCWSIMTVVCGLSRSFPQLFLARMGVSVGEAALTPTAPSIISDNFPPHRRTLPISCFTMAGAMGAGIALIAGGGAASFVHGRHVAIAGIGSFEPWQLVFLIVGLPGLLLSVVFLFLSDPPRRSAIQNKASFKDLVDVIAARRAIIIPHFCGVCLYQLYAYAFLAWVPTFLIRVHGWRIVDVGLDFGLVQLTFGIAGAAAGALLAGRLWRSHARGANLRAAAIAIATMLIPAILATVVHDTAASILLLGLTVGCMQAAGGVSVSAVQDMIPGPYRGQITAIYYAIVALSGVTLGPLLIGLMNDHLFAGGASIGWSMSLTAIMTLPASVMLLHEAGKRRARMEDIT